MLLILSRRRRSLQGADHEKRGVDEFRKMKACTLRSAGTLLSRRSGLPISTRVGVNSNLVATLLPQHKGSELACLPSDSNSGSRRFLSSVRVLSSESDLVVKAKDFLDRTQSTGWKEKELSQAKSLALVLLQQSPTSAVQKEQYTEQAARILLRWIKESNNSESRVSSSGALRICHQVLNTMKESATAASVTEALHLLNQMESLRNKRQRPDAVAFTIVLNMLAASDADANVAEELFQRSLDRGGREDYMVWNSYLHVLSKCSIVDSQMSDKVEEVLTEMIGLNLTTANSFAIVLHALANSGRADRAHALLGRMMKLNELEVTTSMFNTCIDAYAKQGNGERSEALLRTLIAHERLSPSYVSFCSAINAWAKSRHPDAAERAEDLLLRMEDMNCSPGTESFTAAIDAWARSKKPYATKRAKNLLETMETQYLNGNSNVCPTISSYASVIHSFANSSDFYAARDAEMLLEKMKQIAASGRKDFVLNTIAYSTVIDVLAKSRAPDAHHRALALLRDMQARAKTEGPHVAPNEVTYNSVISAFAHRGGVEVAQMLLDEMIEAASTPGNEQIAPDTISYGAVLNAYSKWRDARSSEKALKLLETMESEYKGGNARVKPNTVAYTCAIMSLVHSRSPESPIKAEALLKQMQDAYDQGDTGVKPNSYTLGAVLQVWVSSREAQAPERIASLLKWGEKEYDAGSCDLKPSRICYNYLLEAWAKSGREGALQQVREVMLYMSKSNNQDLKPDVSSYIRLMTAIQQSRLKDSPKQQLRVVKGLFDAYANGDKLLKPNARVLNLALIACSEAQGTMGSKEACRVLEKLGKLIVSSQGWAPLPTSYKLFFDAGRVLGFDNRTLLKEVHQACNETGSWNADVEQAYVLLRRSAYFS
jgi:hypothetical protein